MRDDDKQRLSRECLLGRSVPPSLEILWDGAHAGDGVLDRCQIVRLLTDRTPLDDGYGDAIAGESGDIAANVKAHRTIFEQLGFFAALEDGGLLAYWLKSPAREPPVVELDTEGQYRWLGNDAAEALWWLAKENEEDETVESWLTAHGLASSPPGELGASTQFLPDLNELQAREYRQRRGEVFPVLAAASHPADARDPTSWLLRPGPEVRDAIAPLTGAPPRHYLAWCSGDGLVKQILIDDRVAPGIAILGVTLGTAKHELERALGAPVESAARWLRYEDGERTFTYCLDEEDFVKSISLGLRSLVPAR